MSAADGEFDSSHEAIVSTVDTTGWRPGRHTLFIEARTGSGDWGLPPAVFVFVQAPALTASLEANCIVLRWPSIDNTFYTLLQSSDLSLPFSVLARNLPAQPPTNTYLDPISTTGSSWFYRLELQP
jgi:hypothetical protein